MVDVSINISVIQAFKSVLADSFMDEKIALALNLNANPQTSLAIFGILNADDSTIKTLRKVCRDSLYSDDPDLQEFNAYELKKATSNYVGLYEALVYRLLMFPYTDEELKRIIFLLRSNKPQNIFGGIRALHFSEKQANFLVPFASEMAEFLLKYYPSKKKAVNSNFDKLMINNFIIDSPDKEIDRVLYLLRSGENKFIFGGLKAIGFSAEEAKEFSSSATDIAEIISNRYKVKENSSLISEYRKKEVNFAKAKEILYSNFSKEEADAMVLLTKAYKDFLSAKNDLLSAGISPENL